MNVGRVSPSLALAAYAEAWISGAKVIVFGDALSPLPDRLLERGARHVHVYDGDPERVAEATARKQAKQISYGPLEQAGSTLRDGVFDFGIIEDLAAAKDDPESLLAALGRALSRRGMAVVAARNPDVSQRLIPCDDQGERGIGYYDFYDLVSRHFDEVRMLGQTPFVGYAIADFSASDDGDVRIDTAFLPSGAEEPEWFLALASALPLSPDAFSVIQIPLADLERPAIDDALVTERADEAEAKVAALEATLAQLRAQHGRESTEQHKSQLQALQAELVKREEWLTGLESRAATADLRADEMQSELDRLKADNLKAKQELKQTKQLVDEEQRAKKVLDDNARAHKQAFDDNARTQKQALDDNARAQKQELDKAKKNAEADARRASKLEAEVRSLTQRVSQLSAELAESEKQRTETDKRRAETDKQRVETDKQRAETDKQRADSDKQRAESEKQRTKLAEANAEEAEPELRELEVRLLDRAAEVARLTEALHKTERFGRQLIVELNQLKAERDTSKVAQDLTRLAERNAALEADLEAARWTISSLEGNILDGGGLREGASLEGNVGERHTGLPTSIAGKRRDETPRAEPFIPSSSD